MSVKSSLKQAVMKRSRDQKLEHFYSMCPEGNTILDVGVSPEKGKPNPIRNYFLKTFRYGADQYTGLGVRDLSGLDEMFPGKRFVQYPGGTFPFEDNAFDWVFSNAVIEHVGDNADQLLFLNEMLRVAKNVYFTTPNKHFPVETHTNVLFLHWRDDAFYRWCEKNKPNTTRENLNLITLRQLKSLLERSNATQHELQKNRFFGLTMTFTVVCSA